MKYNVMSFKFDAREKFDSEPEEIQAVENFQNIFFFQIERLQKVNITLLVGRWLFKYNY